MGKVDRQFSKTHAEQRRRRTFGRVALDLPANNDSMLAILSLMFLIVRRSYEVPTAAYALELEKDSLDEGGGNVADLTRLRKVGFRLVSSALGGQTTVLVYFARRENREVAMKV